MECVAAEAWFTDELAARVDAANGAPVAAPNDAPLPGEIGIRPGSWMIAPAGCTMNFVFGSPGSYSIGTAGDLTHLVVDPAWLPSYIAGTRISRILQIAGQSLANSPLC